MKRWVSCIPSMVLPIVLHGCASNPTDSVEEESPVEGVGHWSPASDGPVGGTTRLDRATSNGSSIFLWANGTGALYLPDRNEWRSVAAEGGPHPNDLPYAFVDGASVVWLSEDRVLFWGGRGCGRAYLESCNDTYIYDVRSNAWTKLAPATPALGRYRHTTVWTGMSMIVWGGNHEQDHPFPGGAIYDVERNEWKTLAEEGAPAYRSDVSAMWTGEKMVLWGGAQRRSDGPPTMRNDGALYDPAADRWTSMSAAGAPSARSSHTAVWTGTEMLVWGGDGCGDGVDTSCGDGAAYDPKTDTWRPISSVGAPAGRGLHSAVWTGRQMIVWGGIGGRGSLRSDGGIYDVATDTWRPTTLSGAPQARMEHWAFWLGTKMFVYGGGGVEPASGVRDGAFFTP